MASLDFGAAVADALTSADAGNLIQGVKRAVFDELQLLDPTASIDSTDYYNHSFIPDFVLSWNESGRKTERQVFLRPSIESAAAGHDIESLGHKSPVLLALRSSEDPEMEAITERSIERAPDVLVTDVNAVSQIAVGSGSRSTAPLRSLVKSNLVRGGRGLLVSDAAERLTSVINQSDEASSLHFFTDLVNDVFISDAAARLHRAAQLLEMGITGNLSVLESEHEERPQAIAGKLSDAEIRILLPYLLQRNDITTNPAYWAHIGSLMTLSSLEGMAEDLEGIDLTSLIVPNIWRWSATRASVTFYNEIAEPSLVANEEPEDLTAEVEPGDPPSSYVHPDAEDAPQVAEASPYRWHLHARMLSLVVGAWRIHITPEGRRIRSRQGESAPARWDTLSRKLRDFHLVGVLLNGIQREVRVSSERDVDVYQDVSAIRESIQDDFQVPEVAIRFDGQDGSAEINVDFTKMIAVANAPVPVGELATISVELLTQSNPVDQAQIDRSVLPPTAARI